MKTKDNYKKLKFKPTCNLIQTAFVSILATDAAFI